MNLTSATEEIRRPNSPMARFLRSAFPNIDALRADFDRQLTGAETLAPQHPGSDYPWPLVGTAIDYRIRFYFDRITVSRLPAFRSASWAHTSARGTAIDDQARFGYGPGGRIGVSMPRVSAELFENLRTFLRRVHPVRRRLLTHDEAWLCRYCMGLALVDAKLSSLMRAKDAPLAALPTGATLDDLFGLVPSEAVADTCRLSRLFLDSDGRTWLNRTVTFDPNISRGGIGASADVLVDDCLLDLKTTVHPRLTRAWLDQLLVYLLLIDRHGSSGITRAGVHLVRQARTIAWQSDELMDSASGIPGTDIRHLQEDFWVVARASSRQSPQERWQAPAPHP